jgi:hypothetical protein
MRHDKSGAARLLGSPAQNKSRDNVAMLNSSRRSFVIPAKAGIQYVATSRRSHQTLHLFGLLDARIRGHDIYFWQAKSVSPQHLRES